MKYLARIVEHSVLLGLVFKVFGYIIQYGFVYSCYEKVFLDIPFGGIMHIIGGLFIDFYNGCLLLLLFFLIICIVDDIHRIIKRVKRR